MLPLQAACGTTLPILVLHATVSSDLHVKLGLPFQQVEDDEAPCAARGGMAVAAVLSVQAACSLKRMKALQAVKQPHQSHAAALRPSKGNSKKPCTIKDTSPASVATPQHQLRPQICGSSAWPTAHLSLSQGDLFEGDRVIRRVWVWQDRLHSCGGQERLQPQAWGYEGAVQHAACRCDRTV